MDRDLFAGMMAALKSTTLVAAGIAASIACGDAEGSRVADAGSMSRGPLGAESPAARTQDSTVAAAERALAQGRPWHATELLAPVVRDSARRTPHVVLLAATAAAEWRGWRQVRELLGAEGWVDSLEHGRGRALMARAALGLGEDSAAVMHGTLAASAAGDDRERGVRLVLLARALDRIEARDSARANYERAARLLPSVADWLQLRAAGVTTDSTERATMYAALGTGVARSRVANTEAIARERIGDIPGAIRAFAGIRMPVSALRLRAAITTDSGERAAVRSELVEVLGGRNIAASRTAVEILDSSFAPLTATEELAVGRALGTGSAGRSEIAFSQAFAADLGNSGDRFEHGQVLFRLGRHRDAAAAFARVRKPDPLAGTAAYQRARSLLYAGDGAGARSALRAVVRDHQGDSGAATALYLLADLATDDLRDSAARAAFRDVARQFPRHPLAPTAAFRGALIAYTSGSPRHAAAELDSLVARYPSSGEAAAGRYWAGRAWLLVGDTTRARQRWRDGVARDPQSYYGAVAARRLGQEPWAPPAALDSFAPFPALDTAFARIDLLDRLGMNVESGLEADALTSDAAESAERLLATAARFRDRGETARSIALAQLALGKGAPRDARAYRLIYPVVLRDVLVEESRATKLDPSLVAALIRQESRFVPEATSGAGARGLMQVMPDVGRILARSLSFPVWDPVLLYQPDVNAKLGTRHLADLFRQYETLPQILAAYNAGSSRVERWVTKAGVDDPEMFTERIPYVETRDYVRIVQRNRDLYRALYGWESALVP